MTERVTIIEAKDRFKKGGEGADKETKAPAFSEDAIALTFTELHGADLRYVSPWGKWLIWDGQRWAFDSTVAVFDLARAVCREEAARCKKKTDGQKIANAKTRAAIESLARADRRHAATIDQWDADPWLLNTPSGAVDLRTGDIRPHKREDYCTKVTAVSPGGDCPRWLEFLKRIADGDDELCDFLRRVVGYGLTGLTREHALFFAYGTGANGKSVFLNTMAGALGDYHTTAPMETFIASHTDRHPTELAGLRGARLVTATEVEEGRRWAEAKIKALTGGDPISARFMRQDFFEFVPQFKLLVAGNHKPQLRNVDEAIRRRLHLIPFTVTIPPDERDEQLSEKLKQEWPGILAWAIEGAAEWGMMGLRPPEVVRAATEEYLEAEDALVRWIEDCCNEGPHFAGITADLFRSWREWCETTGEYAGSRKRFGQSLESHGFEHARIGAIGSRGFRGIGLKAQDFRPEEVRDKAEELPYKGV
ncbi:MAG: phage/plasmid primase, P4 family [Alphaproteobacteria bacterium]